MSSRSLESATGRCNSVAQVPELSRLGSDGYLPEVSRRVYEILAERSAVIVRAGHATIVDAVFGQAQERAVIEKVALLASVPFVGLWLDAPERVLLDRVQRRQRDASDADAAVIRKQLAENLGTITWHRIGAATDVSDVLQNVTSRLQRLIEGRITPPV